MSYIYTCHTYIHVIHIHMYTSMHSRFIYILIYTSSLTVIYLCSTSVLYAYAYPHSHYNIYIHTHLYMIGAGDEKPRVILDELTSPPLGFTVGSNSKPVPLVANPFFTAAPPGIVTRCVCVICILYTCMFVYVYMCLYTCGHTFHLYAAYTYNILNVYSLSITYILNAHICTHTYI